ncbi:MAG: J domain-containing protein [Gammaproteobacteria bacterium]|nr:J domain-containing protein [Gammaproteobacteria bacterium]MCP5424850.1 J domain-containing protein [Gammaproteobacteria bacterium]MCP5458173.1 J domain-containing protein [Gammaproteobacteria bacterium]
MYDDFSASGDDEWVIWNGGHGVVTTAPLGHVEDGPDGRQAWLDEPFDMVGPFDLDELLTHGRIVFAACIVMSRQRWQTDQAELRRESVRQRRATQQRMNEEFTRYSHRHARFQERRPPMVDERAHREALNLPVSGALERSQVNAAFRRLAQKAHPDVGGSHEQFVRITRARDVLLETIG